MMFSEILSDLRFLNSKKRSLIIILSLFGLMAAIPSVYAQEAHSDVEFGFIGGEIEIEPSAEGLFVFESDLADEPPAEATEDPGFNNDEFLPGGGATPGSLLGFNVLGPLFFWDGDSFEDPGTATISITDVQGPVPDVSVISGSTSSDLASFLAGSLENIIGQADALGGIHSHVDFELMNGAMGAYGLLMSLTTDQVGIADSRNFGIFINNGLGDVLFEAGAEAFNAQVVPIPAGVWLFASAIGLLLPRTRRKSIS